MNRDSLTFHLLQPSVSGWLTDMPTASHLHFHDCTGPLDPLLAGLPTERRRLSLWRTPARDGTLDGSAFSRALCWVGRSIEAETEAARRGKAIRQAITFNRTSAACHAIEPKPEDLAGNRVLVLAHPGSQGGNAERHRSLIEHARKSFPDAHLYIHSGICGVSVGIMAAEGLDHLPADLDAGQLAALFTRAVTDKSPLGAFLQCCGVTVTALEENVLLPEDQRAADIWLHLVFEVLSVHFDPATGLPALGLDILRLVTDRKRQQRMNKRIAVFTGIHFWKKATVAAMFPNPNKPADIRHSARNGPDRARIRKGALAAWASSLQEATVARCGELDVPLLKMEDGFIRSVGLGAAGFRSLSFVLDDLGIHYDSSAPSRLEHILQTGVFDDALRARAAVLIDRLVAERLTKYNLLEESNRLAVPPGRLIILVPGQVDDDASVLKGGAGLDGRMLLEETRRLNPEAFILYKPHPDVVNGLRRGLSDPQEVLKIADLFVEGHSMVSLLDVAHEVHTISSLSGFEALLRGRRVVCHGQPFYSGWGLTEDLRPHSRRTRRLSLEELVAGTLILYPHYLDPQTGTNTSPETVIDRIIDQRTNPLAPNPVMQVMWLARLAWRRFRVAAMDPGAYRRQSRGASER